MLIYLTGQAYKLKRDPCLYNFSCIDSCYDAPPEIRTNWVRHHFSSDLFVRQVQVRPESQEQLNK